jgi:hypothetical protein
MPAALSGGNVIVNVDQPIVCVPHVANVYVAVAVVGFLRAARASAKSETQPLDRYTHHLAGVVNGHSCKVDCQFVVVNCHFMQFQMRKYLATQHSSTRLLPGASELRGSVHAQRSQFLSLLVAPG